MESYLNKFEKMLLFHQKLVSHNETMFAEKQLLLPRETMASDGKTVIFGGIPLFSKNDSGSHR